MADKKISELTALTGANVATDDQLVIVDTSAALTKSITIDEFKNALDTATGFVRITGDTMTGNLSMSGANITLGDSSGVSDDRIVLGDDSDLLIYHNNPNSFIRDQGNGNFFITTDGNYIFLAKDDLTNMATFQVDGPVELYHSGSPKLATSATGCDLTGILTADDIILSDPDAPSITLTDTTNTLTTLIQSGNSTAIIGTTTNHDLRIQRNSADIVDVLSTGIDVTGTVTADDVSIADTSPTLLFNRTDRATDNKIIRFAHDGEDFQIQLANDAVSSVTPAIAINRTGMTLDSIVFYDSLGSSQSFFWDASAESLGIGTSSPAAKLNVNGNGRFDNSAATPVRLHINNSGSNDYASIYADTTSAYKNLILNPNGGSVGIGTSSVSALLHIKGANPEYRIEDNNETGSANIVFRDSARETAKISVSSGASAAMQFQTLGSEAMRIDSGGVVNIKNTASTANFVSDTATSFIVGDGSGSHAMTLYSGTANNGSLYFADGSSGNATYRGGVQYLHGSDAMRFFTSAAETMRITSAGDLLVGKTSIGNNVGAEFRSIGYSSFTRDGNNVLTVRRKTSDGDIVQFEKDTTVVGSIGNDSTNLYMVFSTAANNDVGVSSGDLGTNEPTIFPTDGGGSVSNGNVSLGYNNGRWKDLYLSGGIYLGGVGAANKLDDYEEGTWTPTATGSTSGTMNINVPRARYVKIGQIVTASATISFLSGSTGVGGLRIFGLPGLPTTTTTINLETHGACMFDSVNFGQTYQTLCCYIFSGANYLNFYGTVNNASWEQLQVDPFVNGTALQFTAIYQTHN